MPGSTASRITSRSWRAILPRWSGISTRRSESGRTNAAYGWPAHALAVGGRVNAAHDEFRRGVGIALQEGFKEVAGQLLIEDSERHAIVAQCSEATKEVSEGLALTRDNFSLETAIRVLGVCGSEADSTRLGGELARRFPEATITDAAVAAARRGRPRCSPRRVGAKPRVLQPVRPYDHTPIAGFLARPTSAARRIFALKEARPAAR